MVPVDEHDIYKFSTMDIMEIMSTDVEEHLVKGVVDCRKLCTEYQYNCTAMKVEKVQDGSGNYRCMLYKRWRHIVKEDMASQMMLTHWLLWHINWVGIRKWHPILVSPLYILSPIMKIVAVNLCI